MMNKKKSKLKALISKVRKTKKYLKWRENILKRDVFSYPIVPKNIQAHHLKNISSIIIENSISSVKEAVQCEDLWKAEGISLTRGEHFLVTRLSLYKYPSPGFIKLLEKEVDRLKKNVVPLGRRQK